MGEKDGYYQQLVKLTRNTLPLWHSAQPHLRCSAQKKKKEKTETETETVENSLLANHELKQLKTICVVLRCTTWSAIENTKNCLLCFLIPFSVSHWNSKTSLLKKKKEEKKAWALPRQRGAGKSAMFRKRCFKKSKRRRKEREKIDGWIKSASKKRR